jgi:hypothetical protein
MYTYEINFKDGKMLVGANIYVEDDNVILVNYMRERKAYNKNDIENVIENRFYLGDIRKTVLFEMQK